MAELTYPPVWAKQDGIVISEVTVGIDGLARDPRILAAAPLEDFAPYAIASLLKSRYSPASQNSSLVEGRYVMKTLFHIEGGGILRSVKALRKIMAAADEGDPGAQYIIGIAAAHAASGDFKQQSRARSWR